MPTQVQDLVDELAAHLGRSVAVDDPGLRLIAHSTHYGDEDPGRVQSLLTRTISGALRKHVEAQRISDLEDCAYLRAEPSVAMAARLCVPLRFSGTLYGYVWVIDDHTMTDPQIRETQRVSGQLAMILAERAAEQRIAEQAAAGDLLTLSTRSAGAREAVNGLAAHFKVSREWRIFVVQCQIPTPAADPSVGSGPTSWLIDRLTPVIHRVVRPFLGQVHDRSVLAASSKGLLVLAGSALPLALGAAEQMAREMLGAVAATLSQDRGPANAPVIRVGVGSSVALNDAADSFDQAVLASRVVNQQNLVRVWDNLGSIGLISTWREYSSDVTPPAHLLPPLLQRILGLPAEDAALVELFLECAGNVARTAEAASRHRATVYYRLQRFEKEYQADLNDGDTRLLLHLWFRLNSLAPWQSLSWQRD